MNFQRLTIVMVVRREWCWRRFDWAPVLGRRSAEDSGSDAVLLDVVGLSVGRTLY